MGIKLNYITALLGAAAAAVAIAAAPAASAANPQSCTNVGGSETLCRTPGNVQINDNPPPVSFRPYGDMPYLLGGHGGLGGHR
jgi:hypothetical protein